VTRDLKILFEILGDDRELIELLYEVGAVRRDVDTVEDTEVDAALVTRTLIRELEVNPPGVEIILRMRAELIAHRRQVAELLALLKKHR
jgi:hypothetical protein